ncbi:hypothetical protein AB0H76_10920 [Nocardia sp. NPDC050712]|uniref:nucleotidyltransferase domain-containing protein n=1 Tax=Nocardia sp. NPDC050712 TaxID=3155518 RepID=UPI003407DB78
MSDDLPAGGRPISAEECERRWAPWSPEEIATRLAGVSAPWGVAAGWALDLFVGATTRAHGDLEISVPRSAFVEIAAALPEYEWDVVGDGRVWPYAETADYPALHQTWLRDRSSGRYHLDVFREPHEGDRWICRRDESITLPYADLIDIGSAGIPYVIPEVTLLFKAKARRPKDDADFARVLPLLAEERKARLAEWVSRVHPGHAWLAALTGSS